MLASALDKDNHDDQEARIAQSQTPFPWPFSVVRGRKIIKKKWKDKEKLSYHWSQQNSF